MAQFNPVQFLRQAAKNSPWVVIAVALHAVIIAVMSVVYLTKERAAGILPPTNITLNTKLPEVVQPPEAIERKAPPKNEEEEVVDYEHDMQYIPTDLATEDLTKEVGDPSLDASSNGATGGTAIAAGAGPGHFSAGLPSTYATRRVGAGNSGRPGGPTQSTEKAVREGLLWLMRHQLPDGSWNAAALPGVCVKGPKCVAEDAKYPEHWQQGLTGLSLLAFLGAGYNFDSKQNFVDTVQAKRIRVGDVVKNGLTWLKKNQQPDGSFGPDQHVYNQALCALALSEAYGLSNGNRAWKEPAQNAIDWLVRAQKLNPDGSKGLWGWRYHSRVDVQALWDEIEKQRIAMDAVRQPLADKRAELKTQRAELEAQKDKLKPAEYDTQLKALQSASAEAEAKFKETDIEFNKIAARHKAITNELYDSDLSATTWVIMAFKSAEASGLTVPRDAYEGGKSFVLSTSIGDGTAGYQHSAQAGRKVDGPGDNYRYHTAVMSALSMLCRTFIDHNIEDPFLEKAAQQLVKDVPEIGKDKLSTDYYYWYYGSLALNQFDGPDSPRQGGRFWDQWNRAMQDAVIGSQDDTEKVCSRGGWVAGDRWSLSGGPIYATAINVLTLEVYYRYANAFGSGKRFEAIAKPK